MTIYRDDLERVYALIERPEAWTKGWFARDVCGQEVAPRDPSASCWCVEGALCKVLDLSTVSEEGVKAREELECAYDLAAPFNDAYGRSHSEVLALLKSAIERAPVRP